MLIPLPSRSFSFEAYARVIAQSPPRAVTDAEEGEGAAEVVVIEFLPIRPEQP